MESQAPDIYGPPPVPESAQAAYQFWKGVLVTNSVFTCVALLMLGWTELFDKFTQHEPLSLVPVTQLAELDLDGLKSKLDGQGMALAQAQETSLQSRKQLAESTKGSVLAFNCC